MKKPEQKPAAKPAAMPPRSGTKEYRDAMRAEFNKRMDAEKRSRKA